MSGAPKSVQVNLRLDPILKQAAEAAAAADRRSLTSFIEKLIADYVTPRTGLQDWHKAGQARLLNLLINQNLVDRARAGTFSRSYSIKTKNNDEIDPFLLLDVVRAVHGSLSNVAANAHLFYPYTRKELAPYFASDRSLGRGGEMEILECVALPEIVAQTQFWRISPAGLASDIRTHFEDVVDFQQEGFEPGTWFCPFFMTRELAGVVIHAYLLSERLPSADRIEFRCNWTGLFGREIKDLDSMIHWLPGKIARVDDCITVGEWPIADIRANWPEMVSALGAPVMRLFDPEFNYSPDWVRGQIPRFR